MTENKIQQFSTIFNTFWIFATSIMTFTFSRYFYIGSKENFLSLRNEFIKALIERTLSFYLLGIVSVLLMIFLNIWIFKIKLTELRKTIFFGLIIILVMTLVGTIKFLSN
jgi:hypothetical protein